MWTAGVIFALAAMLLDAGEPIEATSMDECPECADSTMFSGGVEAHMAPLVEYIEPPNAAVRCVSCGHRGRVAFDEEQQRAYVKWGSW